MSQDDPAKKTGRKSRLLGRLLGREPAPEGAAEAPAPDAAAPVPEVAAGVRPSWLARLRGGLSRTSTSIGQAIAGIFTKGTLDAAVLEELEDILIQADLGPAAAGRIVDRIGQVRFDRHLGPTQIKEILAAEVERSLTPVAHPLAIDSSKRPFVLLIVGVNGSGKTTTIGKLAAKYRTEGRRVVLVAGDTFRAAAIEQLQQWGERAGAEVIARAPGSDPAALAYDALTQAARDQADIILMDTAGRLQNRAELMAELEKIIRVMRRIDAAAPHAVLLVLDATVGQNALSQVEVFGKMAGVTGLVMTKLDGTARGGILVAIADKYRLPVHFIGIGESVDDLASFEARDFARAIAGLDG
jgi:fused signal recognition particle receptor